MIAVSLNVGGGVRLIKPAKLYMCTQNTTNTTRTTHGAGCVRQWFHSGNVVTRIGIHTYTGRLNHSIIYLLHGSRARARASAGAPRILLRDITKLTYLQSDDRSLWYREGDIFRNIPNCKVKLHTTFWILRIVSHIAILHLATQKMQNMSKILITDD